MRELTWSSYWEHLAAGGTPENYNQPPYPINPGDKLANFHCPGHAVEVLVIFPEDPPDSIYWFCENPDCLLAEDDRYRGVGSGIYSDAVAWKTSGTQMVLDEWQNTPEGEPA